MTDIHDRLIDYIGTNDKWRKFVHQVSENTGTVYQSLWIENAKINKELVQKCGWACEDLQEAHQGKTAVMLGASPAIKKQVETLKWLQDDPDFVFIGISSGLEFLLANGIRPKYLMVADADPAMERFWKKANMEKTKDITLIASVCTHPGLLEKWQGPIKFIAVFTTIKKLDRKIQKWFRPVNGPSTNRFFFALSSQYNLGTALAYLVMGTRTVIFVGNEMGFADKECTYYPDREDIKDGWQRKPHIDIYGNVAYSNMMLMSLKLALEDFLAKLSGEGWFFNCTEAGIFGVSMDWHRNHGTANLPWIQQFPLKMGIAQARHIMRTGEPFYMSKPESVVLAPVRTNFNFKPVSA